MSACKCEESRKLLRERDWEISTVKPDRYWGPNASSYNGRLILYLICNKCEELWKNYGHSSKYWKLINLTPYDFDKHPFKINILDIKKQLT